MKVSDILNLEEHIKEAEIEQESLDVKVNRREVEMKNNNEVDKQIEEKEAVEKKKDLELLERRSAVNSIDSVDIEKVKEKEEKEVVVVVEEEVEKNETIDLLEQRNEMDVEDNIEVVGKEKAKEKEEKEVVVVVEEKVEKNEIIEWLEQGTIKEIQGMNRKVHFKIETIEEIEAIKEKEEILELLERKEEKVEKVEIEAIEEKEEKLELEREVEGGSMQIEKENRIKGEEENEKEIETKPEVLIGIDDNKSNFNSDIYLEGVKKINEVLSSNNVIDTIIDLSNLSANHIDTNMNHAYYSYKDDPLPGWVRAVALSKSGRTFVYYLSPEKKAMMNSVDLVEYFREKKEPIRLCSFFSFDSVYCFCHKIREANER